MHTSDYSSYFTTQENEWLSANAKTKQALFEEIEDISNVNPLDNVGPDLRPLEIAIKATKLIITVSKSKILEGPYDAAHFQLIKSTFSEINLSEKNFWEFFSFLCSCKRDEGVTNKQRIYLGAISGVVLQNDSEDVEIQTTHSGVYNMNTNEIQYLKGEGVNAYSE
jgi:hypothetical protein